MNNYHYLLASIAFLSLITFPSKIIAQESLFDNSPSYEKSLENYTIEKIEYSEEHTIIHFRYDIVNGNGIKVMFYPPKHKFSWYLKDVNSKRKFKLVSVQNSRRNDLLIQKQPIINPKVFEIPKEEEFTSFRCEIYFKRLPEKITKVDLIEGKNKRDNKDHYNCFNIKLKQLEK